jgi:hypothetical protein
MTKLVTFNRMMSPFNVGDTRLVPDDVAAQLEAAGDIEANPPDYPAKPVRAPAPAAIAPVARPKLGLRGQTYLTK